MDSDRIRNNIHCPDDCHSQFDAIQHVLGSYAEYGRRTRLDFNFLGHVCWEGSKVQIKVDLETTNYFNYNNHSISTRDYLQLIGDLKSITIQKSIVTNHNRIYPRQQVLSLASNVLCLTSNILCLASCVLHLVSYVSTVNGDSFYHNFRCIYKIEIEID